MLVFGKLINIRTAASMWGRRYGFWLKVIPEKNGARVFRRAEPITVKSRVNLTIEQRLQRIEDGVRFISVLLVKLYQHSNDPHKLLENELEP